jgi:hypothetical protein
MAARRQMSRPTNSEPLGIMNAQRSLYEEIELPDYAGLTEDGRRTLSSGTARRNGVWRVRKDASDSLFPSDFCAERVDAPEKLDLYTGEVYSAINGSHLRAEPKKAMRFLYRRLQNSKEARIQACLRDVERFTYLD